jgi:hypothetical protein
MFREIIYYLLYLFSRSFFPFLFFGFIPQSLLDEVVGKPVDRVAFLVPVSERNSGKKTAQLHNFLIKKIFCVNFQTPNSILIII